MKKFHAKQLEVPAWIMTALEVLRPKEHLPVSKWAEKYRVLPDGNAIPGPWRNSVTPYLVEIMDTFNDDTVEMVIFVKPTQVGGTSALENMLGSLIDQEPAPTMVVYPSDDLAERTVDAKLGPMIRSCKVLTEKYQEHASKKLQLKFGTMTVYLNGANSPADLASTNIRYLFLDEVDKYPGASKKEANPVALAIERTKTYTTNRFIFMTSTPTLKSGHIWKAKEEADAEKHYLVPCPHCGKYIELKFAQIKWPSKDDVLDNMERAEKACYVCQECGGVITDRDKGKMLEEGHWQFVRKNAGQPKSIAYWISTIYSPFTRFSDIAREFMRSKDDPELLQNFSNSWLAEPWEDTKLKTNADLVLERQGDLPEYTVPAWAKLVTAGIDVQENCIYWTIRAWGNYLTSQNIAHGQAISFEEVERIMNLQFSKEDGTGMVVQLALIDSGDNTDLVYDFCASNADWALPSKGSSHAMTSHFKLSKVNKTDSRAYGMNLVLIDTGKYKDMIAGRMRKENGTGSWMVYQGCDLTYAEQVTAEHKVNVRSGQRTAQAWVLKTSHADNHYLDCEVYAMCAADMLGARSLHLEEIEMPPRTEVKQPEKPTVEPENNWLGTNGQWL